MGEGEGVYKFVDYPYIVEIENILKQSRLKCAFKKAFIPKGWTCVNIKNCARDIARRIDDTRREREAI